MTQEQFDVDRLVIKAHRIALQRGAEIAVEDAEVYHGAMMHALEIAPRYENLFPGMTEGAERQVQCAERFMARAYAFFRTVCDG